MLQLCVLLQIFCTFALTGLIWTIQWVHYPSFRFIRPEDFQKFHTFHSASISTVVAPLMVIELTTAALYCAFMPSTLNYVNFALVVAVWKVTAFVSVPLHHKLSKSYDVKVIEKLVKTNWIRTLLWTIKSLIWIYVLYHWESLKTLPFE